MNDNFPLSFGDAYKCKNCFLIFSAVNLAFSFQSVFKPTSNLEKEKKKTGLVINHQLELFQMDKGTQEGAAL